MYRKNMKKEKSKTAANASAPQLKTQNLSDLTLTVTSAGNTSLVNETGVTAVTILMQEDGKIMTSFLGNYSKDILNTLDHVIKTYFKKIKKQLLHPAKNKSENKTEVKKPKLTTPANSTKKSKTTKQPK